MGVIILVVFLILCTRQNKDQKKSDLFKILVPVYFIVALLSMFGSTPFMALAAIGLVAYIMILLRKRINSTKYNKERESVFGTNEPGGGRTKSTDYRTYQTESVILPRPVTKRTKIVRSFNEKYNLYLTDEQIKRMVDSSYMSENWKREVEAMTHKYEAVYEWFQGNTRWLRTYLYVFHVQRITSDFAQQEKIVVDSFEEIMQYADSLGKMEIPEKIKSINDKFYTGFDDVTFMIAYRFLETKGLHHQLEEIDLVKNDEQLDDLIEKYQSEMV